MNKQSNYMRHVGPWNCLRCSFTVPYNPDWGKMSAALMKHVESEHLSDVAGLVHEAQKETATSEPKTDEYTELERLANLCLPGPWRIANQITPDDRTWPRIESLSEPYDTCGYKGFLTIAQINGSTH